MLTSCSPPPHSSSPPPTSPRTSSHCLPLQSRPSLIPSPPPPTQRHQLQLHLHSSRNPPPTPISLPPPRTQPLQKTLKQQQSAPPSHYWQDPVPATLQWLTSLQNTEEHAKGLMVFEGRMALKTHLQLPGTLLLIQKDFSTKPPTNCNSLNKLRVNYNNLQVFDLQASPKGMTQYQQQFRIFKVKP